MTKYHRLGLEEREEISRQLAKGASIRGIARHLVREPSTISREVNQIWFGRRNYRASAAQERAVRRRKQQGRKSSLQKYPKLKRIVLNKLWLFWSPEQIANYLQIHYPTDTAMRVSPATIYAYVYVQPRGQLKYQLVKALRRHHYYRYRRNRRINRQIRNIPDLVSIDRRPEVVAGRKIPGHWEGDLLIGKRKRSALGSLVERTTRLTILAPLKVFDHESVAKAFAREMMKIPKGLRKTMTFDRGPEMSSHAWLSQQTKIKVYFAHSKSPWERGTNENTNSLIRQFFPKGTDFRKITRRKLKRTERLLNQRPRKTLNWQTPEELFNQLALR